MQDISVNANLCIIHHHRKKTCWIAPPPWMRMYVRSAQDAARAAFTHDGIIVPFTLRLRILLVLHERSGVLLSAMAAPTRDLVRRRKVRNIHVRRPLLRTAASVFRSDSLLLLLRRGCLCRRCQIAVDLRERLDGRLQLQLEFVPIDTIITSIIGIPQLHITVVDELQCCREESAHFMPRNTIHNFLEHHNRTTIVGLDRVFASVHGRLNSGVPHMREGERQEVYTHTHIYIYIYIYI